MTYDAANIVMRALLPLLGLSSVAQALYFFIDGQTPKCFIEDLPKDTLVVGHYSAEEWDDHRQAWWKHDGISVYISVDVSLRNNPYLLTPLSCPPGATPYPKALNSVVYIFNCCVWSPLDGRTITVITMLTRPL